MGELGYRLDIGVIFIFFSGDREKEREKGFRNNGSAVWTGEKETKRGFGRLVCAFEALIADAFLSLLRYLFYHYGLGFYFILKKVNEIEESGEM